MKPLSTFAIESILERSSCPLIVGYVRDSDLEQLPSSNRIMPMQLENTKILDLSVGYQTFSEDSFFRLVELKWNLFQRAMNETSFDFFVYSDLDVIWLLDPIKPLSDMFRKREEICIAIQDASIDPSQPNLCMGIFAFRNCEVSRNVIEVASNVHKEGNNVDSRYGDDEAISSVYAGSDFRSSFALLPQPSFPVGKLASLGLPLDLISGLSAGTPFIFHANYLQGLDNKFAVLKYFMNYYKKPNLGLFYWALLRSKLFIYKVRKLLRGE